MEGLIYTFAFAMGAIFGSFFNVVIYRFPRDISIVTPPSSCPACTERIRPLENIPILSYLFLRGKCRHCGGHISIRYPIVETLGGVIVVFSYFFDGFSLLLLRDVLFYSILLLVAFIDFDTGIIPDTLSIGGLLSGVILEGFFLGKGIAFPLLGALTGGGILYGTAFAYELITGREGLGGGDIKLLGAVGAFTGYGGSILTIFSGSVVGAAVGIALMISRGKDMKMAIPFGPFLAAGAILSDIFLRNYTLVF